MAKIIWKRGDFFEFDARVGLAGYGVAISQKKAVLVTAKVEGMPMDRDWFIQKGGFPNSARPVSTHGLAGEDFQMRQILSAVQVAILP